MLKKETKIIDKGHIYISAAVRCGETICSQDFGLPNQKQKIITEDD